MREPLTEGVFHWDADERVTDRYGSFYLYHTTQGSESQVAPFKFDINRLQQLLGQRVRITVEVVAARKSGHVGDLFHKIYPSTPNVGEVVDLGVGTLLARAGDGGIIHLALKPNDGREFFWMDPHKLYRLHDQTVKVFIETTDADFSPAPDLKPSPGGMIVIENPQGPN